MGDGIRPGRKLMPRITAKVERGLRAILIVAQAEQASGDFGAFHDDDPNDIDLAIGYMEAKLAELERKRAKRKGRHATRQEV